MSKVFWFECHSCGYVNPRMPGIFNKPQYCWSCNRQLFKSDTSLPVEYESDGCEKISTITALEKAVYDKYIAGNPENEELHRQFLQKVDDLAERCELSYQKRLAAEEEERRNPPIPKCPTCSSTNIRRIGGTERGVSVVTLGLMSSKISKTFKCNYCGYMW